MAPLFPLTSMPALRSHLCVALSSDTVKSILMIPFRTTIIKRPAGRQLWPELAGNYGPAGRGKRLYAQPVHDSGITMEVTASTERHCHVFSPPPCVSNYTRFLTAYKLSLTKLNYPCQSEIQGGVACGEIRYCEDQFGETD